MAGKFLLKINSLLGLLTIIIIVVDSTALEPPINIPIESVPRDIIQSALTSLNQQQSQEHKYKNGKLTSAQKLVRNK